MAAKTKINDHGDVIFTEQEAIDLLYINPEFDVSKLYFNDNEQYQSALKELGIDLPTIKTAPQRESLSEFDKKNIDNWHMPDKYYQINVLEWLLDKCQTDEEKMRVQLEYDMFYKDPVGNISIKCWERNGDEGDCGRILFREK